MKSQIAVVGLAVMGQNLVLNLARNGFRVIGYNRSETRVNNLIQRAKTMPGGENVTGAYTVEEMLDGLESPRVVLLMVQAGAPVDSVLQQLIPLLSPGDIVMDGGNSFFQDTRRRAADMEKRGFRFMGVGVSGGEEGALNGPSIMPGGSADAWRYVAPMLQAVSAKVDGQPCCDYLGADGAGHFVKVTHNGIEYGDMQLICEAYQLLRDGLGLSAQETQTVFADWNAGELDSYLIEITAEILKHIDPETGNPLVDMILDTAGQKGTGKWTSQEALELGVSAPTVAEAVYARCLSARKADRVEASKILAGPEGRLKVADKAAFIKSIGEALYASKICSYAQGFEIMSAAAKAYGWTLDFGKIALMWRGGCIIRARFLQHIKDAYDNDPQLSNLMLAPYFQKVCADAQQGWREVVAAATCAGIPIPSFSSALSYYDGYRTERLPANLLQAQRDYFGAHTYERVDKEGFFHTQWF